MVSFSTVQTHWITGGDLVKDKMDEQADSSFLATNGILLGLYDTTWEKCSDTLANVGHLYGLDVLGAALVCNTKDTDFAKIKVGRTGASDDKATIQTYSKLIVP